MLIYSIPSFLFYCFILLIYCLEEYLFVYGYIYAQKDLCLLHPSLHFYIFMNLCSHPTKQSLFMLFCL